MEDREIERPLRPPKPRDPHDPEVIVAIGASAGGLEALEELFDELPCNGRAGYVVVQHLSPDFRSLMDQLLARHTDMAIHRAEDGLRVEADSIYLIPPRQDLRIRNGALQLSQQTKLRSPPTPIDIFFRSLAEDRGDRAIGVILSGTGSDGSRGAVSMRENGGVVLVQDPRSAKFDGMPQSAILAGAADVVLPPAEIGQRIVRLVENPAGFFSGAITDSPHTEPFLAILDIMKQVRGLDFSLYKEKTIHRRLLRRINALGLGSMADYRRFLEEEPTEPDRLYSEFLIGVTEFFRDREAFAALRTELISMLGEPGRQQLRVWCMACSTGEEAYTIAIMLDELRRTSDPSRDFKIFATDVDPNAVKRASDGIFPDGIQHSVPEALLQRYFERIQDGFRITRELRDRIVFAPHNGLSDPPFTRMDLVTCRNMLIYLQPEAQQRALERLDFALHSGGVIFLGQSESLAGLQDGYEVIDAKWKLFRKKSDARPSLLSRSALEMSQERRLPARRPTNRAQTSHLDFRRLASALIHHISEACVVVSENYELLHTVGEVNDFLAVPVGVASFNVMEMLPASSRSAVSAATRRARKSSEPAMLSGVMFLRGNTQIQADLQVLYVPAAPRSDEAGTFIMLFGARRALADVPQDIKDALHDQLDEKARLERELYHTRENLNLAIEELETTNEELQSTNEEMLASNEELQSTNEELHSVNEELFTVNAEHQRKIEELTALSNDMENLLQATEVGTLFLDSHLRIRRFTPAITRIMELLPGDLGRPIDNFAHRLVDVPLSDLCRSVLDGSKLEERKCHSSEGVAYLLRVRAYLANGVPTGVVVTLVDLNEE